jgi:hypothetical protein
MLIKDCVKTQLKRIKDAPCLKTGQLHLVLSQSLACVQASDVHTTTHLQGS